MSTTIVFILGVLIAVISVLPPGLLNMSAVKISLNEGKSRGVVFSVGASLVVILQTYIGAVFARYLSNHPEVIEVLREIALGVFVLISIYFLFIAKSTEKVKKERRKGKKSSFFNGLFLSSLNFFPIPYHAYMTITLESYGWMDFSKKTIFSYVIGVGIGSLIALYGYVMFSDRIKNNVFITPKNMNYIIGGITGVVAVITLFNVLNY